MKKEFAYTREASSGLLWSAVIMLLCCAGLLAYHFYTGEPLRFKKKTLDVVYVMYWAGFSASMALISGFFYWRKKKLFEKIGNTKIILHEKNFEFTDDKGENHNLEYEKVKEFWIRTNTDDEDENEIIVYYSPKSGDGVGERFVFSRPSFVNEAEYFELHEILSEKCVNITNREK